MPLFLIEKLTAPLPPAAAGPYLVQAEVRAWATAQLLRPGVAGVEGLAGVAGVAVQLQDGIPVAKALVNVPPKFLQTPGAAEHFLYNWLLISPAQGTRSPL